MTKIRRVKNIEAVIICSTKNIEVLANGTESDFLPEFTVRSETTFIRGP